MSYDSWKLSYPPHYDYPEVCNACLQGNHCDECGYCDDCFHGCNICGEDFDDDEEPAIDQNAFCHISCLEAEKAATI